MIHDPTLLQAYWGLRSLCEDLLDEPESEEERLIATIETWLLGHCATCGVPLERARRKQRVALCVACERALEPPSPPSSRPDPDVTPF